MALGRICVVIFSAFIRCALFWIGIWETGKFNGKNVSDYREADL
jgi:hypothetical protein